MVEFQTIKQCKEAMKGSFIGVIIKESELKAGTKDGKDWTMKRFTIQDAGDSIELTAWNEKIQEFSVGNKYEFTGFWFKKYNESVTMDVGKYGKAKLIGTATVVENTQSTELNQPTGGLGELPVPAKEFVELETVYLLQIEQVVKKVMSEYSNDINGQKCGMFTKEIYRKMQKSNFMKYGDGFDEPV